MQNQKYRKSIWVPDIKKLFWNHTHCGSAHGIYIWLRHYKQKYIYYKFPVIMNDLKCFLVFKNFLFPKLIHLVRFPREKLVPTFHFSKINRAKNPRRDKNGINLTGFKTCQSIFRCIFPRKLITLKILVSIRTDLKIQVS